MNSQENAADYEVEGLDSRKPSDNYTSSQYKHKP